MQNFSSEKQLWNTVRHHSIGMHKLDQSVLEQIREKVRACLLLRFPDLLELVHKADRSLEHLGRCIFNLSG
jgi:hypothetical protein